MIDKFTLSTPALRMKLPFLFHFRAKIGPLCWPSVLARLPAGQNTQRGNKVWIKY